MIGETWFDCDHIPHEAREPFKGALCERCEADTPAVVDVYWWGDEESGGSECLCEAHYLELRAEPWQNPKGGFADRYVNLGAAL